MQFGQRAALRGRSSLNPKFSLRLWPNRDNSSALPNESGQRSAPLPTEAGRSRVRFSWRNSPSSCARTSKTARSTPARCSTGRPLLRHSRFHRLHDWRRGQSFTDLAVETTRPSARTTFARNVPGRRHAGAVSEYAHEQEVTRHGASQQLQRLANTAITAFEILRTGRVGVGGNTGAVVLHSLMAIRDALVAPPPSEEPRQEAKGRTPVRST